MNMTINDNDKDAIKILTSRMLRNLKGNYTIISDNTARGSK